MNSSIPTLRPNYTVADFKVGHAIVLRSDGSTGVPQFMHGKHAVVVKTAGKRLVVARVEGFDHRQLRITPNQVAIILDEAGM